MEQEFDFGEVTTLGNSSVKNMTIINNSNIESVLILDLRPKDGEEKEGLECLEIKPISSKNKNNLDAKSIEEETLPQNNH